MKSSSTRFTWKFSGADVGFIAVVGVAYLSALVRVRYGGRPPYSRIELFILIAACISYLIIGVYGFALSRRNSSLRYGVSYLAGQSILAAAIIYLLPAGAIFLILFPLAGQSVVLLPRIWAFGFCLFVLVT